MIKRTGIIVAVILMVICLVGCGGPKKTEHKVTCTMCNGTGEVKYYYGDGDNDYNMGPCTSCDGKGYTIVEIEGDLGENEVICGSCGKVVDKVITRKDNAGESRTWCQNCWDEYDEMMGN